MSNPNVRMFVRAAVVAGTTFLAQLQASDSWDASLLRSAIVAAFLAGLEYLTPLNPSVGPPKK